VRVDNWEGDSELIEGDKELIGGDNELILGAREMDGERIGLIDGELVTED